MQQVEASGCWKHDRPRPENGRRFNPQDATLSCCAAAAAWVLLTSRPEDLHRGRGKRRCSGAGKHFTSDIQAQISSQLSPKFPGNQVASEHIKTYRRQKGHDRDPSARGLFLHNYDRTVCWLYQQEQLSVCMWTRTNSRYW